MGKSAAGKGANGVCFKGQNSYVSSVPFVNPSSLRSSKNSWDFFKTISPFLKDSVYVFIIPCLCLSWGPTPVQIRSSKMK
ncbi:hypothetical protein L596_009095 [Steinernema carpocapsae]|uniref:Uncharacterized protein n=1 Tax=Steinernema carpocapsae TaxID=34508 RepID=A0A4U5PF71_STECR|nr:hypothetical protein L596_009095 [Steinernema carpocapsae]